MNAAARVAACLAILACIAGCSSGPPTAPTPSDRLRIVDVRLGRGAVARPGDVLRVHYVGRLTDGTLFDRSLERGPFVFRLGAGQVILGWEEGLQGMRAGGRRRLVIPPDMAYGARGYPPAIPANATLIFDVWLLGVAEVSP